MSLKTRIAKMQQQAPVIDDGRTYIMVISWDGDLPQYYEIVDGERVPCSLSDIPGGDNYFDGAPITVSWDSVIELQDRATTITW